MIVVEAPLVLVVDDEPATTHIMSRIFEREGYRVAIAGDGAVALQLAQTLTPDLILLDYQMPGMNGFQVLAALREYPATRDIPTIIVTAVARQPQDVAHGMKLGADDFLGKPFDPGELLARAESKLKARRLEADLKRKTHDLEILLRLSATFNQQIPIGEMIRLIPYSVLDLIPGDTAAIYMFNADKYVELYHVETRGLQFDSVQLPHEQLVTNFLFLSANAYIWNTTSESLAPPYPTGMAIPVQHGNTLLALLVIVSADEREAYDQSHLQLLQGIGQQAALALRNAQYLSHLMEMVEEKTNELRSAQELLIRAEKMASIGHLAASLSHEINNPLQPMKTTLDDMLEDIQHGHPIDPRAIQITLESVDRIRRIVLQLLDFAGKRTVSTEEFALLDVAGILDNVIALNRKLFEKENQRFEVQIDRPLPTFANKDQLEQVFMNLILNAQAAMPQGGLLRISGRIQGNNLVLQFIDNGSGIAPEIKNKIFDPYFSTKPNGTGLGLFVTYGIIQNHHGTIEVESKLGRGTAFTISLPAQQAR